MVILRAGFGDNLDARPNAIVVGFDAGKCNVKPMPGMRTAIHPKLSRCINAGGDDIDASVSVKVSKGAAAMPCFRCIRKAGFGYVCCPLAATCAGIAENSVGLAKGITGRPGTGDIATGDKEILPAIVVEVVKRSAKA